MELEVGKSIPGGYHLTEKLGSVGWYVSTWRARDPRDQEVVVRFHHTVVSDDDAFGRDLRAKISPLCPGLDRLVTMPETLGLAPWRRYSYDPDGGYLFLVRRYYAKRLDERFPPMKGIGCADTPRMDLVAAFRQLGEGLDALCGLQGEGPAPAVHEDNLFMDGPQAVMADYGCSDLQQTVESGYDGPRPMDSRFAKRAAVHLFLMRTAGDAWEKAQCALAAAYFRVRTGCSVFGDLSGEAKCGSAEKMAEAYKQVGAYISTHRLDLSRLPHPGERDALTRSLAINPRQRFRSCVEFVNCLPS